MATMNVSLPDELVDFVRSETASGGYGNQSDVVRDALRLLREQKQKRAVLTRLLDEGRAAVAAGKTKPLTTTLLREIADRGRKRARKRHA
ncbi:MAG: type II toxin-antitoxin system ParD family antitoxin [Candidatus Eremiobacteraeota bacterium]|nr:type II toxin-antitoxin system ParD family antitoxin [Candidatus Eremiobacteraeota bacterium]